MKQKLTRLNDDMLASEIEQRMDEISGGKLPLQVVTQKLNEIEQLIKKTDPESRVALQMYFDMFKDRVARFYLQGGFELGI